MDRRTSLKTIAAASIAPLLHGVDCLARVSGVEDKSPLDGCGEDVLPILCGTDRWHYESGYCPISQTATDTSW